MGTPEAPTDDKRSGRKKEVGGDLRARVLAKISAEKSGSQEVGRAKREVVVGREERGGGRGVSASLKWTTRNKQMIQTAVRQYNSLMDYLRLERPVDLDL